jgi:hypothetical protein
MPSEKWRVHSEIPGLIVCALTIGAERVMLVMLSDHRSRIIVHIAAFTGPIHDRCRSLVGLLPGLERHAFACLWFTSASERSSNV